mmetsp:Transcript_20388/g.65167  ORF Transcript_20388/g.65167 Transcript_20388/m.65167 type:complete len:375 (-) Transcript_20388:373-1497(-)
MSSSFGTTPAAQTAATCSRSPAVRLESIHAASLRSSFLPVLSSRWSGPRAPPAMSAAACAAVPAAMFPTARNAGVCTEGIACERSATSGKMAPASTSGAMRSGGSERYEIAQQASVSTSSSVWRWSSLTSTGTVGSTNAQRGGGLPRQRLESSHVAFRCIVGAAESNGCVTRCACPPGGGWYTCGWEERCDGPAEGPARGCSQDSHCGSRRGTTPYDSTRSRHRGESPAMLPKAHIDCSRKFESSWRASCTSTGTAPLSRRTRVCSEVPEATLVTAHAASNASMGSSKQWRNCTSRGTTPASMISAIGGFRSIESSLRNRMHASSCCPRSSELSSCTSSGRDLSVSASPGSGASALRVAVRACWGGCEDDELPP